MDGLAAVGTASGRTHVGQQPGGGEQVHRLVTELERAQGADYESVDLSLAASLPGPGSQATCVKVPAMVVGAQLSVGRGRSSAPSSLYIRRCGAETES